MKSINQIIEDVEKSCWSPERAYLEISCEQITTTRSQSHSKKCRIGYDKIDSFMLIHNRMPKRYNVYWHLLDEDYLALPETLKENIWICCLLSYSYLRKGITEHPTTLQTQDALISLATGFYSMHQPKFATRALQYAIELGSDEAVQILRYDYIDIENNIESDDQQMDLSCL